MVIDQGKGPKELLLKKMLLHIHIMLLRRLQQQQRIGATWILHGSFEGTILLSGGVSMQQFLASKMHTSSLEDDKFFSQNVGTVSKTELVYIIVVSVSMACLS